MRVFCSLTLLEVLCVGWSLMGPLDGMLIESVRFRDSILRNLRRQEEHAYGWIFARVRLSAAVTVTVLLGSFRSQISDLGAQSLLNFRPQKIRLD